MGRTMTPAVALTVAGTDSGGCAGVAADLKTFAAHGVHGIFAVTLVTAQNTAGIVSAEPMPTALVESQIDALTSDFAIAASKTGLLYSVEAVHAVADRAAQLGPLVVDPVLVSSTGRQFVDNAVVTAYVEQLFPVARVITPNVAEASLLTGRSISSRHEALAAATALVGTGIEAVLITGLLDGDRAIDVLATSDGSDAFDHDLIETTNVLGTGCSLSASIAAHLAQGDDLVSAVSQARAYVLDGLRSSAEWHLGAGRGPIDHLARWPGLR